MARLSEAQRRALGVFASGYTATTMRPQGGSWWSGDANGQPRPRQSTLFALRDAGIKWRITPAGRRALQEADTP